MKNLKAADISTVPENNRECMICREPYGETHLPQDEITPPLQFRNEPEAPVRLACNHYIGLACLCDWVGTKNNFKFNNTCPYCRTELYKSEIDQRLFAHRNGILQARHTLLFIVWNNVELNLGRQVVADRLRTLDNLVNEGAALGDVYNAVSMRRFNGPRIARWWQCVMERHIPYFLETIPEPVNTAFLSFIRRHYIWTYNPDHRTLRNDYVEAHLEVDDEQESETMSPLFTQFYDAFFKNYTCRPSKYTGVVHHSMMPSQIFIKTLATLQRHLTNQGYTGDAWDLLRPDKGNINERLYGKICMLQALNTAAHATHSHVESLW